MYKELQQHWHKNIIKVNCKLVGIMVYLNPKSGPRVSLIRLYKTQKLMPLNCGDIIWKLINTHIKLFHKLPKKKTQYQTWETSVWIVSHGLPS